MNAISFPHKPRLLVVDDESLILDSFRFAFPAPQYEVITAATGRQALELFSTLSPDVVICDIKLPDMTGIDLFRKLHTEDPKIPVILMTGHGTAGTAIDAMRAGAFEYVLKPLDPDTLIPLVESAIETSRLMRVPAQLPAGKHFGSIPDDSADVSDRVVPGDAGSLPSDRSCGTAERHGPDPWGKRDGQRSRRPSNL